MSEATSYLYRLALRWDEQAKDSRDAYPYRLLIDELLFHAELRYVDYLPYHDSDGAFAARLMNSMSDLDSDRDRKALLLLLRWVLFVDRGQMHALCRDAYRRIVLPWLCDGKTTPDDLLAPNYEAKMLGLLSGYRLCSITESFGFSDFLHLNEIAGLEKPLILGHSIEQIRGSMRNISPDRTGLVIFEDIVGTGRQAGTALKAIKHLAPAHWRLLFVPLIIQEGGASELKKLTDLRTTVEPVLIIARRSCLQERPVAGEPEDFRLIRSLIKRTAARVMEELNSLDDPPGNCFGYKGSGALIITCHNAPNNTLPILHHRAPAWRPLFRRIHH